ncbi:SUMF1/EgtB/PvdO family nonheme iron enzyme [Deinococcus apachensis]|uniref:SUMF1/EgtB/PvdO family nonheme iron enzyme n=1 Tax=Deinococcus apachensis TaxID=309886 RepID=UPI000380D5BD|nr:SUMF1/EgtB/PvdO family nonheme iron enzyme [Deinococcus apachensis]
MNTPDFSAERLIPAPEDPAGWEAWRTALAQWRNETRQALDYDGGTYQQAAFAWVPGCYVCCMVMLWDELFYDRHSNRFTPERFLEHGRREFGGYDAVVLWHAYPNLGFDGRNQFDVYRDGPGGLQGLRELVAALHLGRVRVFLNYNPWDTGTRPEPGGHLAALAELVGEADADGVFLDTMRHGSSNLRTRLDEARPGVALESESTLPLERVHDHQMSWAQWYPDTEAPGVLRNRWFERRHMMHHTRRWDRDHSEELHSAWMNGAGILVWENVFGSWNGWHARDRSLLRAMISVQRAFSHLFSGEGWVPLMPTLQPRVYASLWQGDGLRLWTLVNRGEADVSGPLLEVEADEQTLCFDLITGELAEGGRRGETWEFGGRLAGRGVAAFLALEPERLDGRLQGFLAQQRERNTSIEPDTAFPERQVRRIEPPPVHICTYLPEGMIAVPAWSGEMRSVFRLRECGTTVAAPFVNEWRPKFPRLHTPVEEVQMVNLVTYALDQREVTNGEFLEFLCSSGYRPSHTERFLDHWHRGEPLSEEVNQPVTWVDLDDAQAYALWAGKRLPTETEWQHAFETQPLAFTRPAVDGPVPRVWNWTESEHTDGHTRFCLLKGGSDFAAQGSEWYADGGPRPPAFTSKLLLGSPGINRRATVGFRCAVTLREWG